LVRDKWTLSISSIKNTQCCVIGVTFNSVSPSEVTFFIPYGFSFISITHKSRPMRLTIPVKWLIHLCTGLAMLPAFRRHQTPAKEAMMGEYGLVDLGVSVVSSWWRVNRRPYSWKPVTKVLTPERVCRNWRVLAGLILSWFPAAPVPQVRICTCNHTHLKITFHTFNAIYIYIYIYI
jgi:hypothetical protein